MGKKNIYMKKRVNITFNKVSQLSLVGFKVVRELLNTTPYSETEGYGFQNIESDNENAIYATLIKRIPTSIKEFDIRSDSFVKRDIFLFDEISFGIDFEYGLIYSFGPGGNLTKVKSIINNLLPVTLSYANIDLKPLVFWEKLSIQESNSSILEVSINRFTYDKGAVGKFTAKIFEQTIGEKLINESSDEISRITMEIHDKTELNYLLSFSIGNSISLKCDNDDLFLILNKIINIIK